MSWYILTPMLAIGAFSLLMVVNPTAAGKLWSALMGQLSKLASFAYKRDPVAVLQHEADQSARNVNDAWEAMEEKQAFINNLQRAVKSGEAEAAQLKALAEQEVHNGNDTQAKAYLTQLVSVQRSLETNKEDLAINTEEYNEFVATIEREQANILRVRAEAKRLSADLKISQASARVARAMPKFDGLNSSGIDAAREAVQEEIDRNRAAGQVARTRMRQANAVQATQASADSLSADQMLAAIKGGGKL